MMNMLNRLTQAGRRLASLALVVALSIFAARGVAFAEDWKEVQVPIGGGKFITVQGPPRIAYFPAGGGNNYLIATTDEMDKLVAKIPGATMATFDPNWDALTQLNMMQNAIASGKYNAFIVDTLDPVAQCKTVTQDAPAANIAVVTVSAPMCGRHLLPDGHDAVAEGLTGGIGNANINAIHDLLKYVVGKRPGPQKVIVVTGPPLHALAPQIDAAVEMTTKEFPEFEIIATLRTNFSTIQAFNKLQPVLVAHPETTVVFSANSDISQGVVKALKLADMLDKVKVFEMFGDGTSLAMLKAGELQVSTGVFPRSSRRAVFNILNKAFHGEPFERVVLGDGGPAPADSAHWSGAPIIDKSNIDTFKPEF
jgi:ribose transport system substrate-binding protein